MATDPKKPNGFVLLYAVLVSGVILGVGLSLINLITTQIILSSIGRNSQFAYYAADAGKQCAYYWYASLYPVFGVPAGTSVRAPDQTDFGAGTPGDNSGVFYGAGPKFYCDNQTIDLGILPNSQGSITDEAGLQSSFYLNTTSGDQPSCASVVVQRVVVGDRVVTTIQSSGYNASCADVENPTLHPDPRRIERVVYRVDK